MFQRCIILCRQVKFWNPLASRTTSHLSNFLLFRSFNCTWAMELMYNLLSCTAMMAVLDRPLSLATALLDWLIYCNVKFALLRLHWTRNRALLNINKLRILASIRFRLDSSIRLFNRKFWSGFILIQLHNWIQRLAPYLLPRALIELSFLLI